MILSAKKCVVNGVSELGGYLGMFLGVSFFDLKFLVEIIPRSENKKIYAHMHHEFHKTEQTNQLASASLDSQRPSSF